MKKILLIFISPVLLLVLFLAVGEPRPANAAKGNANVATTDYKEVTSIPASAEAAPLPEAPVALKAEKSTTDKPAIKAAEGEIQELIDYALSLIGTPYEYAGISESGFDCSGFTSYVYDQSGVGVGRSSSLQAEDGYQVPKEEVRAGDLLIFTGTDKNDRTPGHVGIVISSPGDTISFVHSSSNGGVKISQVEGTGYDERFLQARRVMEQ
ncbi:C40 family peptidase [Pontibacter beigongshangensis]|uniref:C40 family peptidase n=1 Tax=Pontibacter beigongshangensis TaxID=2574733 RepID=UPI00164F4BAE|nr:C40 family peptidase [Pontibacter beigongshangensis]